MGTGPWRILFDVVVREALGPLILGYTYVLIAIVDMTAIAGAMVVAVWVSSPSPTATRSSTGR